MPKELTCGLPWNVLGGLPYRDLDDHGGVTTVSAGIPWYLKRRCAVNENQLIDWIFIGGISTPLRLLFVWALSSHGVTAYGLSQNLPGWDDKRAHLMVWEP